MQLWRRLTQYLEDFDKNENVRVIQRNSVSSGHTLRNVLDQSGTRNCTMISDP